MSSKTFSTLLDAASYIVCAMAVIVAVVMLVSLKNPCVVVSACAMIGLFLLGWILTLFQYQ